MKYLEFDNSNKEKTEEYFNWMDKYPNGYVLNPKKSQKTGDYIIHISGCNHIADKTKNTDGSLKFSYIGEPKICSIELDGIKEWKDKNGVKVRPCETCEKRRGSKIRDRILKILSLKQIEYEINTDVEKTPTEKLLDIHYSVASSDEEEVLRTRREISVLNRNQNIVNALKRHYGNKCQLCNTRIKIGNDKFYSEVHHLKPLGMPHNGPDIIENMIVVCPNCHVELDYQSQLIDANNLNCISPHFVSTDFINYQNKKERI